MSNAKPMGSDRRGALYGQQSLHKQLTPRQSRRYWHKQLHADHPHAEPVFPGKHPAMDPKGRATPRRPRRG